MSLAKRIKQITAPSGADFKPRGMLNTFDLALGSTNVVDVVKFYGDDADTDNKIVIFTLPKNALVDALYVKVNTVTTVARTFKVGIVDDEDDGFLLTDRDADDANAVYGLDPTEDLGEYLATEIDTGGETSVIVTHHKLITEESEVEVEFSGDPSGGEFTAWVSYTMLVEPKEEPDFTKPERAEITRIREDEEYLKRYQ